MTRDSSPAALRQALIADGFSDARHDLAQLWPSVTRWLSQPIAPKDARHQVLGFECGLNRHCEGRDDHPQLPEGLASRPMVNLSVFRVFDGEAGTEAQIGQDEHGVEWWYLPDADLTAVTAGAEADREHHIGHHFWGFGADAVLRFVSQVQRTPMFAAALTRNSVLTRAFAVDGDGGDLVARSVGSGSR